MPELRNPRWEKFARFYVELGNASKAYRKAGYSHLSCDADAARLRVNESVQRRINEIRAQNVFQAQVDRRELEGFLAAVIRTPSGEVTPDHPLSQSHEVSAKGVKVRMPDKVQAAASLARLSGWDAAQRVDVTVNPLTDYLRALRSDKVRVINEGIVSE